jgi:DNA gyrase inhibitor GyrI
MNNPVKTILAAIVLFVSINTNAQETGGVCYNPNLIKDTTKKSIRSMAVAVINGDSIKINYHSPGVRKRIIWGGLVPYDEVWVTGAHDATTLEMPKPFIVNGKEIPAGKYAFFTIPGKTEWILIINSHWKQHLASEYDEKQDIVRIKVEPKKVNHTERLQYFIESKDGRNGIIAVAWEMVRAELPFAIKQ